MERTINSEERDLFLSNLTETMSLHELASVIGGAAPAPGVSYANQKTLAGAVEMYNLDKNTQSNLKPFPDNLLSNDYLQALPDMP